MRKNLLFVLITILSPLFIMGQEVGVTQTSEEFSLEGEAIIVISPTGDTLSKDNQPGYLNSGIYKSTTRIKNGCIIIKLDSTKVSQLLGTKLAFDLKSVSESNGVKFNSEYPTIINLWSTTCKVCIGEIPFLNQIAKEHIGFNYLAITSEPDSLAKPLLKNNTFSYNIITERNDIIQFFRSKSLPVHIYIDKNMIIRRIIAKGFSENDKVLIDWFFAASQ